MGLVIEIADLNDQSIELMLRQLIKAAFKTEGLLPAGHLSANIESDASKKSFFLIAKENNEIIGCNGFIANDFTLNGADHVGYQSCWTATHPLHQGKGIFISIINEAKKILKNEGAGFLYGIPNDTSRNIFVNKLGFVEIGSIVKRTYNIPFYRTSFIKKRSIANDEVCAINEKQVKDHKAKQSPEEVKTFYYNNSLLWGKLLKRPKLGISWPVFYIGGIQLENENDLQPLMEKIFKAHTILFVQSVSTSNNTLVPLIKNWQPAKMNPFILFNLNMPAFKHFNIMIGSIDIF